MAKTLELVGRVHHGDCIQRMSQMQAGSVDLAFADPPFNIGFEYDEYDDRKERDEYLGWSRRWISAVHRVLKPTGTFWLAIGDEYAAELKLLCQDVGFHPRSWVIWYYTFGVNCKAKFSRSHAHLFYFTKDPAKFTFRAEAIENRIPSARQLVYADARANPSGRLPDDTWVLRPQDLADCFSSSEDTWYFPRVAGTFKERAGFHGCQMPEQLLGRIIRFCSEEGEVVLDPFSGSATTVAVARKLGRLPIGIELSNDYVAQGNRRLSEVCVGDPLEGSPEPTVSAPSTPTSGRKKGTRSVAATSMSNGEALFDKDRFVRGLISAFEASHAGYAFDNVLANPELNSAFVEKCQQLGLPGDARTWNWQLLTLRKAGKLKDVPTTKRTEMHWKDCDEFLFASEIAQRKMFDLGFKSLDEILCDPVSASQFDAVARELAPSVTSFFCRWGAFKLRKEAKVARTRSKIVKLGRFSKPEMLHEGSWEDLPSDAAIYLVRDGSELPLYVGEAWNLQNRFRNQFSPTTFRWWKEQARNLTFSFFPAERNAPNLLAYQLCAVNKFSPQLNLHELAAI